MIDEMSASEALKKLYQHNAAQQEEIREKFCALGPFGEFAWTYLLNKLESSDTHEAVRDRGDFQRELMETIIREFSRYRGQFEDCRGQGMPFGEALEKARENLKPLTARENEVVEFCLKWTALENIVTTVASGTALEDIADIWHVSHKCVREAYNDFPEVIIGDYMGVDIYQSLPPDEQEELMVFFKKVLTGTQSVQEYAFLVKGIKARFLNRLQAVSPDELFKLPKEKARHAMKVFLSHGGTMDERALIAWAKEKGIKQEELESLIALAAPRRIAGDV